MTTTAEERRALGARLCAERKRRGWMKPEMARRLREALPGRQVPELDSLVSYVKRWEAGKINITERYRLAYATAFGMDESELFGSSPATAGSRRSEYGGALAASEAVALAAWLEQSNVGEGTLDHLAQATRRLSYDYARRPPLEVLNEASELQEQVTDLLRKGRQRIAQTKGLLETSAELFALINLLAGDIGRYPLADAYGHVAWTCAEESNSHVAQALVLCAQSKTARWEGRNHKAAELARRGFELSPAGSRPRVLLAVSAAIARQAYGDISGACEALERAQQARDEIDASDETADAWSCPRARQATYALQVGLGAGDCAGVLRQVQAADSAWADGDPWVYGTWAQVRIGAALAHVMNGDPQAAAVELGPVFDLDSEYRVVTIIGRMGEVSRQLDHNRYQGNRHAAGLQERIRAFEAGSLAHRAIAAPEVL